MTFIKSIIAAVGSLALLVATSIMAQVFHAAQIPQSGTIQNIYDYTMQLTLLQTQELLGLGALLACCGMLLALPEGAQAFFARTFGRPHAAWRMEHRSRA